MRILFRLAIALVVCGIARCAMAAEEAPFAFRPGQTDQFAGATCTLRVSTPAAGMPLGIHWRLTSERRTLAQGNTLLKPVEKVAAVEHEARDAVFELQTPEIENGVVLDVALSCYLDGSDQEVVLPLRLRGPNPFAHVRETLEKSEFTLFDPVGKTEEALNGLEVTLPTVSSLQEIDNAPLVIIGEGVEWDEPLIERANELVRQGMFVLVLRPQKESTWPLDLSATGLSQFRLSQLADSGLAPQKLNIEFFGVASNAGWGLQLSHDKLQLAPENGPQTWPIAEYHSMNQGRCLFVGFPLIAHWSASPVPRELLAEILTSHLTHLSAAAAAETD